MIAIASDFVSSIWFSWFTLVDEQEDLVLVYNMPLVSRVLTWSHSPSRLQRPPHNIPPLTVVAFGCFCVTCQHCLFSAVVTAVAVVDPMVPQTLLTPPTGHADRYSYVLLFFRSRGVLFTGQFSSPSLDILVSTRGLSDFFDLCLQCATLDHIHLAQSVEGFQSVISAFKLFNLQKERMQTL